ncbi:MAG: ABC transporter permease [Rhodobacteraceae bacterium]|nr:ABC transporter permease [Paracoccaceae bacterium]
MIDTTRTDPKKTLPASDGTLLRKKLHRVLLRSRLRAFGLVVPLLLLIIMAFLVPVVLFLVRAVYNDTFSSNMPNVTPMLAKWDPASEPTEEMYAALVADLIKTREDKSIGRVATHVNRQLSGTRSLFTSTARRAARLEAPFKRALISIRKEWGEIKTWHAMKIAATTYTTAYIARAVDMQLNADGSYSARPEDRRIHVTLFLRTMEISIVVTLMGVVLGYPIAFLLANLPVRTSNLLLILVLLPFWTSLLVRTTAWIAMLQGQGVLNDLFVIFGIATDEHRFSLIYNKTGTLIAMTHILLPFMILPLYSVMKTIPPSYVLAARSMGASPWTAFWSVYFPQSIPGIGAGGILVFILAISFYITPALVGGQDGTMISNFIDFHMRSSLDWSLAAAMGLVLLVIVLFLYWLYDRVVGIDNMKLG